MLKEDWNENDILSVNNINDILTLLNEILTGSNIGIVDISFNKFDWLYKNQVQTIENKLQQLCNQKGIRYQRRIWSNMSIFSYKDVNRWCRAINLCNLDLEDNKMKQYISNYTYMRNEECDI